MITDADRTMMAHKEERATVSPEIKSASASALLKEIRAIVTDESVTNEQCRKDVRDVLERVVMPRKCG